MSGKAVRPGRPLEFEPDTALQAAMRLFWERGFESTSLDELESRTGLSRSSLYNSFGSKRQLFECALAEYERRGERLFLELEEGHQGLADVHAFMDRLVAQLCGASRRPPGCFMVNSVIEFGGRDATMAGIGRRYFARVESALACALRRAVTRGEISAAGLQGRAKLLVSMAIAINVQARAGAGREGLEALRMAARSQVEAWRREARNARRAAPGSQPRRASRTGSQASG